MMSFSNQLVTALLSSNLLLILSQSRGGIEIHKSGCLSNSDYTQKSDCSVLRSINEKFICSTNRKLINFPTRRDSQTGLDRLDKSLIFLWAD